MAQRGTRRAAEAKAVEDDSDRRPENAAADMAAVSTTGSKTKSALLEGRQQSHAKVASRSPSTRCRQVLSAATASTDRISPVIALEVTDEDGAAGVGRSNAPAERIRNIPQLKQGIEGMCQTVFASLGRQQSEGAYQRALQVELELRGIAVEIEVKIFVTYRDVEIGSRRVDLLLTLEDGSKAIVEMKAVQTITKGSNLHAVHQLQYYLDAFDVEHGFLVNFPHDAGFPAPSGDDFVYRQEVICGVAAPLSDVRMRERKTSGVGVGPEIVYFQRVRRLVLV